MELKLSDAVKEGAGINPASDSHEHCFVPVTYHNCRCETCGLIVSKDYVRGYADGGKRISQFAVQEIGKMTMGVCKHISQSFEGLSKQTGCINNSSGLFHTSIDKVINEHRVDENRISELIMQCVPLWDYGAHNAIMQSIAAIRTKLLWSDEGGNQDA